MDVSPGFPAGRRRGAEPAELRADLFRLCPPYDRLDPVRGLAALEGDPPCPGVVVALELSGPPGDWRRLRDGVRLIRSRVPAAAVVVLLGDGYGPDPLPLQVAAHAAKLHVRGVCSRGACGYETLRLLLTQPLDLPGDVVEWLSLRGRRISPDLGHLVREIFTRAHAHTRVSDLLAAAGVPERSARFRFRKKRWPPPNEWHRAARALEVALRVQAAPRQPLLTIALDLGYSDHSSLSHQFQRTFGLRPGRARGTLGWEWLLWRWFARSTGANGRPARP